MNTYNDNLHSSVVKSLGQQELEIQSIQAELDASIYTLYFAQGAQITDEEQLSRALKDYDFQAKIKKQAVDCHSLSVNVNATAQDQKKYTGASVTNTATAAADVQIATNAIIRLASNMGSIFSIVNAADYGQDIYHQSKNAYEKMNQTAYEAEVASKLSMEASSLTAEVSFNTVADQAKAANDAVTAMLTIASKDFDNMTDTVAAKNADLANASDAEKEAEGVVEYVNTDYNSTKKAYLLNNEELNLNLRVPANHLKNNSYTVEFNQYINPFFDMDDQASYQMNFPVEDYYIFLVKYSNQSTFSIAEAEGLTAKPDKIYIKIPAKDHNYKKKICKEIMIDDLRDSDGALMELGKEYVVFVLAKFYPAYQRAINCFDEYLTASSKKFILTNHLLSPLPQSIWQQNEHEIIKDKNGKETPGKLQSQWLFFWVKQKIEYKVEYRCMFLPDKTDLVKSLLTDKQLNKIEDEVKDIGQLQKLISEKTDLKTKIDTAKADVGALGREIERLGNELKKAPDDKKAEIMSKMKEYSKDQLFKEEELIRMNENLGSLDIEIETLKEIIFNCYNTKPGFFFNLNLAENVSLPNYALADTKVILHEDVIKKSAKWVIVDFISQFVKDFKEEDVLAVGVTALVELIELLEKLKADAEKKDKEKGKKDKRQKGKEEILDKENEEFKGPVQYEFLLGAVRITPDSTGNSKSDNFGNLLIDTNDYLPAILSFSTDEESQEFTNSLSDFCETLPFTYHNIKSK